MRAKIIHLETCTSDYFRGNGDRPTAAIPVDGGTTNADMLTALDDDDWNLDWGETAEAQAGALVAAIADLRRLLAPDLQTPFDTSLPVPSDDDDDNGESVIAYFGIEWSDDKAP